MAELHRVEINDKAPNEIEPEAEEAVEVQQEEPQQERPEWLPEKFKSAEDMAQAYASLEKRMGAGAEEVEEEQPKKMDKAEEPPTEEASNYNEAVVEARENKEEAEAEKELENKQDPTVHNA